MRTKIIDYICLGFFIHVAGSAWAANPVPATGGVLPSGENSDQLSWQHFIAAVAPVSKSQVLFETWASDPDIYTATPHWPTPEQARIKKLRPGLLQLSKAPHALSAAMIDGKCSPVSHPKDGNFPVAGSTPPAQPIKLAAPQPCYAEEVRRNRPSYDYLTGNGLNTQAGLAIAYQKAKSSGWRVSLPTDAVEVKVDWVPIDTIVDWLAANHVKKTVAQVKTQYYTTMSGGTAYALVSLHISSKEIPNWVWASFEHQDNPGRCDTMGCYDSFGAARPKIPPAPEASANGQYGNCAKSPAVAQLFKAAHLDGVWQNYCLKSSQIDFVAKNGEPLMLGDSFTERIAAGVPILQSSCMACHASAAVNKDGSPFTTLLSTNPMGNVTLPTDTVSVDFIWGVINLLQ
ncbi:hypothetical protein [Duganella hordei]|uniref:hypothetical protein n=1 Tax=Duganella hordei TaxID=2865934 RepID=UPI003340C67E